MNTHKRSVALILALFIIAMGSWLSIGCAATYNDFISGNATLSKSAYDPGTGTKVFFLESRKFDFSSVKLNGGSGVTHGDVVNLFTVPKGTYLMGFGIRVLTGTQNSGTSCTVGDSAGAATLVSNTAGASYNWIKLDGASVAGASIWQAGLMSSGTIGSTYGGVSIQGVNTLYFASNNGGNAFKNGVSCYDSQDTIKMTIQQSVAQATANKSGATPVFEAFIWGFKKPLE